MIAGDGWNYDVTGREVLEAGIGDVMDANGARKGDSEGTESDEMKHVCTGKEL